MTEQPTGTVTHLFTDIEGSTGLWERCPETMQVALERHDELLQEAIVAPGGRVVKTLGDGFYAVFATATDALAAALAGQRALQAETWGEVAIKVRMGLHTGAAEERDGDYFGPALNRAARLMSAGHGGQILLSRATRELVRDQLPAGVQLHDLGRLRLKGLDRAEQVFQAVGSDLPTDFPHLATLDHYPNNLPAQATPFVGREAELAELGRLLADPDVRLVTIVGAGGMGKTRLALEAAAGQLDRFEQGVFFVSLAPLDTVEAMVPTVAEALGFSFYEGGKPQRQLLDYLRPKSMLLIMDNFEHLLGGPEPGRRDGVGLVSDVLKNAPGVKVLSTSRARLNMQGEHLFHLSGMDLPDWEMPEDAADPDGLAEYSAIKLFLQSARRVRPGFGLAVADLRYVTRICRLVGGMPLGIVLAAGWLTMLTPVEIAAEIEASVDFLETELRDVPERQRSMRAVFDHSWKLLTAREQAVMEGLSVFRGGFDREAAQQVAGATLGELRALVDRSLLQRDPTERYGIHELLRQYAADRLHRADRLRRAEQLGKEPADKEAVQDRHCTYYAAFLQQREADLRGRGQKQALAEIGAEIENVRTGWDWAVSRGKVEEMDHSLDSLAEFYRVRSRFEEGEEAFARAVRMLTGPHGQGACQPQVRRRCKLVTGKALSRQGVFCHYLARWEKAKRLLGEAVALLRELNARRETAYALYFLGRATHEFSGGEEVEPAIREALAISREIDDRRAIAFCLMGLGVVERDRGEMKASKQLSEESLAICRELGNQAEIANCLRHTSFAAWTLGDYEEAKELGQEALALCEELDDQESIVGTLEGLGCAALGLREYAEARQVWKEGLALSKERGTHSWSAELLHDLAELANVLGDYAEGMVLSQETLAHVQSLGSPRHMGLAWRVLGEAASGLGDLCRAGRYFYQALVATRAVGETVRNPFILVGVAGLLAAEGEKERALELLALVLRHPAAWQWTKDRAALLAAELKADLPPDVVVAAQARGQALDLDGTVQELLVELGERKDAKRET
jgi:predicted ATPase/class 3 adenylate cyclase